jgi:predicted nuclease with TOPRIM domain
MEEKVSFKLDEKIQRLIDNYNDIKNKFIALKQEKAELKGKLQGLESIQSHHQEEMAKLKQENEELKIKLAEFTSSMKSISEKLDSAFENAQQIFEM